MTLPPDPIQQQPTYDLAKAAFEALPPIRVLFDNGAGNSNAGWPYPGFERSYSSFPIPGTTARSWYVGARRRARRPGPAADAAADGFTWDAHARPLTNFTGDTGAGDGGLWTATPNYQWSQDPAGSAVAYATAPLGEDTTVVGAGAVDVWVRSSTPERRPPGDDQRGPARRQGDLRAGRLGARQRAQARRRQEHAARARPEPPRGGLRADASTTSS